MKVAIRLEHKLISILLQFCFWPLSQVYFPNRHTRGLPLNKPEEIARQRFIRHLCERFGYGLLQPRALQGAQPQVVSRIFRTFGFGLVADLVRLSSSAA